MNKFTLLMACLIFFNLGINAQEIVVAGWTFPEQSALADQGIEANMEAEVMTMGGTSDIQFKNGLESKAAQVTEWNDGMDTKAWVIEITTSNYENLTISSLQQSGGNDPGPKDYKLQYSIEEDIWVDIANGEIAVENDWTTSAVENLPLPEACSDVQILKIRWLMASNEASGAGGSVLETGKNKIENVFVRGDLINGINDLGLENQINIFPNPTEGFIHLGTDLKIEFVQIVSLMGRLQKEFKNNGIISKIDLRELPTGNYIMRFKIEGNSNMAVKKITIL